MRRPSSRRTRRGFASRCATVHTGFLVPHGDVAAMAAAMRRVAGSRELVERAGRRSARVRRELHLGARRRRDRGAPSASDRGRESRVNEAADRRPPARTSARTRSNSSTSSGPNGLERTIENPNASSPGLVLAGYIARFPAQRLQVLGETEITYLQVAGPRRCAGANLEMFFSFPIPCVFITKGQEPGPDLVELAASARASRSSGRSSRPTSSTTRIKPWLEEEFAPTTNLHGSLADVFGVGLLFVGKSGIGKSECVLDLVERGHRLVADDLVIARRRGTRRLHRPRARAAAAPHGDSRRRTDRHPVDLRHSRRAPAEAHRGRRAAREVGSRRPSDRTGLDTETTTILDVRAAEDPRAAQPGKEHHRHRRSDRDESPAQIQRHRRGASGSTIACRTDAQAGPTSRGISRKTMSSESRAPVEGPRAIVAGHGDFAAGLVSAVEQISGRGRHAASRSRANSSASRTSRRCCARDGRQRRARDLHRPAGGQLHDGVAPDSARHGRRGPRSPARTCRRCSISSSPTRCRGRRRASRRRAGQGVDRRRAVGGRVTLELYRIDDRLIHGQVVVGWGQPLDLEFIVLVDDAVATSDWEQELYRMGVPPEMDVYFHDVADAATRDPAVSRRSARRHSPHGDIATMRRLVENVTPALDAVNIGGIHSRAGRATAALRVPVAAKKRRSCARSRHAGVNVTAQDVPGARPVALEDVLSGASREHRRRSFRSPCSAACSGSTS